MQLEKYIICLHFYFSHEFRISARRCIVDHEREMPESKKQTNILWIALACSLLFSGQIAPPPPSALPFLRFCYFKTSNKGVCTLYIRIPNLKKIKKGKGQFFCLPNGIFWTAYNEARANVVGYSRCAQYIPKNTNVTSNLPIGQCMRCQMLPKNKIQLWQNKLYVPPTYFVVI